MLVKTRSVTQQSARVLRSPSDSPRFAYKDASRVTIRPRRPRSVSRESRFRNCLNSPRWRTRFALEHRVRSTRRPRSCVAQARFEFRIPNSVALQEAVRASDSPHHGFSQPPIHRLVLYEADCSSTSAPVGVTSVRSRLPASEPGDGLCTCMRLSV